MAVYKRDIIDIELERGTVHRSFANRTVGEWDELGDVFGVRLHRNGQEVPLDMVTCTGYFERPDGSTVVILGDRDGSLAWVQLPKTCYAITGQFKLTIKVTLDDVTATVRIVDGTVVNTAVGDMIDPGSIVPDMEGLEDILGELELLIERLESFTITANLITGTRYRIEIDKGSV